MSADSLVIALLVAVVSPLVLQLLTGRQAHRNKVEDWARQDAIAEKAAQSAERAEAAQKIAAEQREANAEQARLTAGLIEHATVTASEDSAEIKGQLSAIHAFVNGSMTAALKAQLVALQGQLGLLDTAHPEMHELAETIETQIQELEVTLAEREKQQKIADAAAAKTQAAVAAIEGITQAQAVVVDEPTPDP